MIATNFMVQQYRDDARLEALVHSLDAAEYALRCYPVWFQNSFCNKMLIKKKMIIESK